jgi:reactive intermediate/imine deaminase
MSNKSIVNTPLAPAAIGPYSQGVRVGNLVFFSGQIPLDPVTMTVVSGAIEAQAVRVFDNLQAVSEAAGGDLCDIVKLTIFLTDLADFTIVNDTMKRYFESPFPARSTVQVSALPRGVAIEVEAIMALPFAG